MCLNFGVLDAIFFLEFGIELKLIRIISMLTFGPILLCESKGFVSGSKHTHRKEN